MHAGLVQLALVVHALSFCMHAVHAASGMPHAMMHTVSPQAHFDSQAMYVPQAPPKVPVLKPAPMHSW